MLPFDVHISTRFVHGSGTISRLGELAKELGSSRALVVSDAGVVTAGHTQRGLDSLSAAGVETALFQDLHENPTDTEVNAGVALAKDFQPDLIVGLGGGSSMDCAKGINFVYTGGGRIQDYWGVGKANGEMLPSIGVPTTAGTGSEAQSFALITDAQTHAKMACGDKRAAFKTTILDPDLTVTQPAKVTALTAVDAISHALETYVTSKRNAISLAFSREAWRYLAGNFRKVIQQPDDLEARAGMQIGACFAGLAIENSMLGAAHALANPLTAAYGIVHGQAVGLMLPAVIRFNGVAHGNWYNDLLAASVGVDSCPPPSDASTEWSAGALADYVEALVRDAGLQSRLNACSVDRNRLPELAQQAAGQWTGQFNPRPVDADNLLQIYETVFE